MNNMFNNIYMNNFNNNNNSNYMKELNNIFNSMKKPNIREKQINKQEINNKNNEEIDDYFQKDDENHLFLVFTIEKENIQIYLKASENLTFKEVKNNLENKYISLQKIGKKSYKWKIKILKTYNYDIMVGIAPIDFDINSSSFNTCGWYFRLYDSYLYSGPPHNYSRSTNLMSKKDEIIVVMNMNKRTLKFIINKEDKGESYTDIPIDKPLFPAVLLYNQNDSVEIIEC